MFEPPSTPETGTGTVVATSSLMRHAWADFRRTWRQALGFQLLMQAIGLAVFAPLVTAVGRRVVLASGEPVISNFDIAAFVLSPAGGAFLLTISALTLGLLLTQFAGHTWIAGHALTRRRVTLVATIAFVLRRLPSLVRLAARMFLRLVLLALPFLVGAGLVWLTTLRGHDINYYLAEHPPEWRRAMRLAGVLGASFALLVAWQLARWLYAVPALVFGRTTPAMALRDSQQLTTGQLRRVLPPVLALWLSLAVAAFAIAWVSRGLSETALDWAGFDVRRVLVLVALFTVVALVGGVVYVGLQLAGHQFLVTRFYAAQVGIDAGSLRGATDADERQSHRLAQPALFIAAIAVPIALGLAWRLASQLDLDDAVAITAHRGASIGAPENTMAAFRAAMDAGATYIELDVQHTRDREIAVLHDGDLMRMGSDPRKLAALSVAELASIDIGRKYGAAFSGERAPTLEQVIDLVRGRTKINIELKYNVPDPDLAPAVIALLKRKGFLDQVVITSLDHAALRQVKALEPRLQTGHIVTAAVGDVVRTDADFLSLNAARATPELIRRAHAAGKAVHVWTVNQPEVMLRMLERGVDNIITDDPARLAQLIRDRAALDRAERLALRLRVLFDRPPPQMTDPAAVTPL
jgi:glycerophosphoryl diester phosphodiesterase